MKSLATLAALAALSLVPAAFAGEAWLHIDIKDSADGEAETVKVNIPLSMIERLLPAIQDEHIRNGKIKLDFNLDDDESSDSESDERAPSRQSREIDLKAIVRALRETPDGDFVKIRDHEDNVSISKAGDFILINVDSRRHDGEKVRVRMPLDIADAITQGDGDELDLVALMRSLSRHAGEDLVTVEDGDTRIRIWVDGKMDTR